MSSFPHEYPIRILNHGHNTPMMTDRREFPNCLSLILQSLSFEIHEILLKYMFSKILQGTCSCLKFFSAAPHFQQFQRVLLKLHFFHLNIFILCQILSRLSSKQMHFSLVSQEKKGFTNIWLKQNTFIGVTYFQIWLQNMKFWTFVCLIVCFSGFDNFARWKMVQSWFQYLNSNQGCDFDGNLPVEIAICNFDLFHSAQVHESDFILKRPCDWGSKCILKVLTTIAAKICQRSS